MDGPRCGEPIRAGLQGIGQLGLHRGEVVVGGLFLEGTLAHHVGPQRRVADVRRVVDSLRERSTASRYSAKLVQLQSMPAARAAPEMSSARSRLRTTRARASGDAGASVKPQWPMTTVVTPCQHEFVPSGSQNTWASRWVWPSMKPGVTTWPSASMSVAPRSWMRPIVAMRPSAIPTSARYGQGRCRRRRCRCG